MNEYSYTVNADNYAVTFTREWVLSMINRVLHRILVCQTMSKGLGAAVVCKLLYSTQNVTHRLV